MKPCNSSVAELLDLEVVKKSAASSPNPFEAAREWLRLTHGESETNSFTTEAEIRRAMNIYFATNWDGWIQVHNAARGFAGSEVKRDVAPVEFTPKSYEVRKGGGKKIYGLEVEPGRVRVMCDCDVIGGQAGAVLFFISTDQADKVLIPSRAGHVQDICPELPQSLRDVFISGVTPLEWERDVAGAAPDSDEMKATWLVFREFYSIEADCVQHVTEYFGAPPVVVDGERTTASLLAPAVVDEDGGADISQGCAASGDSGVLQVVRDACEGSPVAFLPEFSLEGGLFA